MKKIALFIVLALPVALSAQTAKIKIDIERTIGEIDPKIYGVFMEPIGFNGRRMGLSDTAVFNTVYGNLYDPSSPLADKNGFRKDYIEAAKECMVTNMRWPGGNFVMAYNWQDGIGPKEKRPVRKNIAWTGIDNNHVGTDEWIELNKAIGSENVVCTNLGLGTIDDARYWVEYCNTPKGTYYSDLRIKNGHEKPYNVRIWDLGNEVDGSPWELGHKTADEYARVGREAAKALKATDKTIKLVASGSSYYESTGQWVEWNRKVLTGMGDLIDYLSIHRYWENSPDYYTFMGQSAFDFEEKIKVTAAEIEAVRTMNGFKNAVYISFDEWGTFGRDLLSVLPVAQSFNAFIRHTDIVKMANFTMLTGLLASDREKGTFKSPLFYTFKLFSNNCRGNSIDTYVECDTFNTASYKGIPFLDVTAVFSKENNTVFINVVNRHQDKAITADIISTSGAFAGKAVVQLITGDLLKETFAYDKREQYVPATKEIKTAGNTVTYAFPPHSFTQIEVKIIK